MDKQAAIKVIWRDQTLTPNERQLRIRELMMPQNPTPAPIALTAATPPKTWYDKAKHVLGCEHYARQCQLVAPCCQKIVPCRLCHDEADGSHIMDRYGVRAMRCMQCGLRQPIREKCRACKVTMAEYYCDVCHLYIGKETGRLAFHCDLCGMCRVGKRDAWQHCHVCGTCLLRETFDTHICLENCMKQRCAVCQEDMMTSVKPCEPMRCGHFMHRICLQTMISKGQWRCTVCQKAMLGPEAQENLWAQYDLEIVMTPLPERYRDKYVRVYCRECEKHSDNVPFHFVGLKCPLCGGYNTAKS